MSGPFLDLSTAARDPALVWAGGRLHCFYTAVERGAGRYRLFLDTVASADGQHWSAPRRLTTSPLSFSSPGNALWIEDHWELCLQSYPVDPGGEWGNESSRLWLMRSPDLAHWDEPRMLYAQGCQARWAQLHRQIDPYLVAHAGSYYCFYKTAGQLGLLVSPDLEHWEEASPDRPVLSARDTPDGASVENPCVLAVPGGFAMFYAPCRAGRGISLAYSPDLLHWHDAHDLAFPPVPWAANGPSAGMVIPWAGAQPGAWLMAFHGERPTPENSHSAALALAWSDDLEHWRLD